MVMLLVAWTERLKPCPAAVLFLAAHGALRCRDYQNDGDTVSVQTFSGESRQGVDEARAVIEGWLGY